MRSSDAHEHRQAYAQAVVCADGTQLILATDTGHRYWPLILATNLVATTADAPSFAAPVLAMQDTIGLPPRVLADTGYASGPAIKALQASSVEPLVAIGRTQPHRPYDFRPPLEAKKPRKITEPWRIAMTAKPETGNGQALYRKRKQTVEPVFGIIKAALGFRNVRLRGLENVTTEWTLIALAYNCRRIKRLQATEPQLTAPPRHPSCEPTGC